MKRATGMPSSCYKSDDKWFHCQERKSHCQQGTTRKRKHPYSSTFHIPTNQLLLLAKQKHLMHPQTTTRTACLCLILVNIIFAPFQSTQSHMAAAAFLTSKSIKPDTHLNHNHHQQHKQIPRGPLYLSPSPAPWSPKKYPQQNPSHQLPHHHTNQLNKYNRTADTLVTTRPWSDHPTPLHLDVIQETNNNSNNGASSHATNGAITTTTTTFINMTLSDFDTKQIEQYFDELLTDISYLGTQAVSEIHGALVVAYRAHRGQMRKSGEPFIIHPVQVAKLLAGLKMDAETIMAGLLHDTVEDTDMTFQQVEMWFGPTVRGIVEGETKVSKLPKMVASFEDYADEQAENLRQMFVAMTDDYRIIVVKLADRLHNMRTLKHMKPAKQIKISRETLDIFAPLAHRMGIWQFKSELEDTAFMYLYPIEYRRLQARLRTHQARFQSTLQKSQALLQQHLNRDPTLLQQASVEVFGRTKEIYSLWHKMESKGVKNLDQIGDLVALRVIITPHDQDRAEDEFSDHEEDSTTDRGVWLCYHVLGLVQHLPGFTPVPTRVKDYISFAKPNGYQSLHTALILNGQPIEVQIRTRRMHQVAEYGMASHWAYKDGNRRNEHAHELYNTPWLASIKDWQNERISSRDFVDSVRRELLGKRVFVFLRNGKILNLARGATAIDAAFAIHTAVGLSMFGVEINGKPVPFSYELQNGDVVSVLTGEQGKPATDWMRYAKSRSTRSKLRSYFRARQKESLREAGKVLLEDYLSMHRDLIERESYLGFQFRVPNDVEEIEMFLPGKTQYETVDDLLIAIGNKNDHNALRRMLHKVVSQLFEVPKKKLTAAEDGRQSLSDGVLFAIKEQQAFARDPKTVFAERKNETSSRLSVGTSDASYSQAEQLLAGLDLDREVADPEQVCSECLPVYGDQVVGTRPVIAIDGDDGSFLDGEDDDSLITTVHRIGCHHAQKAINDAHAEAKIGRMLPYGDTKPMVDSISLRRRHDLIKSFAQSRETPVKLHWQDDLDEGTLFLAEVVLHCYDRKLLLADCSEVVSETVEILKTGSLTTDEHATLIFLVQVTGLHQLQELMDRLSAVPSVMSVERRFGSELL